MQDRYNFGKKIQVTDPASSPLCEISGATLVANLIGYATIIMQIGGRLAAADRAELKFRPRLGEGRRAGDERLPVF